MDTSAIINAIITILASGGVILVLREQIKAQKEQLNFVKTSMEAMKTQLDLYDPDKLNKYAESVVKIARAEWLDERQAEWQNEILPQLFKIQKQGSDKELELLRKQQDQLRKHVELKDRYDEMLMLTLCLLLLVEDDKLPGILADYFPKNKDFLQDLISSADEKQKANLRERMRKSLGTFWGS